MCGISAVVLTKETSLSAGPELPKDAIEMLRRRGPDSYSCTNPLKTLALYSTILSMQKHFCFQPFQFQKYILCFNGEIYDDNDDINSSDTERFFHLLTQQSGTIQENMHKIDSMIEGEFSFILYCGGTVNKLYYGRDIFGRRSLMKSHVENKLYISSIGWKLDQENIGSNWAEIPVNVFFEYDLRTDMEVQHERRQDKPVSNRLLPSVIPTWRRMLQALESSIKRRIHPNTLGKSGKFAILFSGGIDSVIIAALAHRCTPIEHSIVLVNVSFQEELSPDRIASRDALEELKLVYPKREWELVAVNPTFDEVKVDEPDIVKHIFPKNTVMDFNIGAVLWFASKGSPKETRALLSGFGADELCGGYGRHKQASVKGGVEALRAELELDLSRMWTRNLGRDDRCVSAHGKELRIPFLDKEVVSTVFDAPLSDLVDFSSSQNGRGDKLVLRTLMKQLGFPLSAEREKRAAQFGSRMAKLVKSGRTGKGEFHPSALIFSNESAIIQENDNDKGD